MANPGTAPSSIGAAIAVVGLGLAAAGLFALPIQALDIQHGSDVGYLQLHQLAAEFSAHPVRAGRTPLGGFARFWWQWGLLLAGALTTIAVSATVVLRRGRIAGIALTAIAVITGVLHALALHLTPDYRSLVVTLRVTGSLYDHSGAGLWLTFIGLAALVIAGVLSSVGPPAAAPYAMQPPPRPGPAAPPA